MPRRLEHFPNAQYEQILATAASGQPMRIDLGTEAEATRFRNAYNSWRSVVLREHRAGRLPRLPYGFDEVATEQRKGVVRFLLREMTPAFQALRRVVAEVGDEHAQDGGTGPRGIGGGAGGAK